MGETSAWEEYTVRKWLEADASNNAYFEQLRVIWNTSNQLALESQADENQAWKRFQQQIHTSDPAVPVKQSNINWLKVAAAIVIIAGLSVFGYLFLKQHAAPGQLAFLTNENVTSDTLPDGTMVTLNKNSALYYPALFKGNTRKVSMSGEAFFNVTPNKTKPFIIEANGTKITVVGTSFNVRSGTDSTEVIVETGVVRVYKNNKTIELKAGEKVVVGKGITDAVKETVTDKLYNHYRTRQFVCDNTPLWKLVEALNETYDTTIIIENNAIKDLPITTTYNEEPLDHILGLVQSTHANIANIKIIHSGNKIILK